MARKLLLVKDQQRWSDNIDKEDRLRLRWFRKNENALTADANIPHDDEFMAKMQLERIDNRKQLFQEAEKYPMLKVDDAPPLKFDPDCLVHIMKPVAPETRKLLYTGTQKDGRLNYLHEREKIIPDQKYYFPETTSFRYGWKMWDHAKTTEPGPRYGKSQIIRQSFYRRRGVDRDPIWYSKPVRLSPTVCDCD